MLVGIIAGEASGDILAAGLIRELKQRYPEAEFVGVCGPKMVAEGAIALESIERLAVFGLVEIIKDLPQLLKLRKTLVEYFVDRQPDVFIGVDAPEFNLGVEKRLKAAGIPTVHYVSPSVWAWRQGRIKGIQQSVDLMLTLLPFEAELYQKHQVSVQFVGHPLADELHQQGGEAERQAARQQLNLLLPTDTPQSVIAVMPGSRGGELKYLLQPFLETAQYIHERLPGVQFVLPAANPRLRVIIDDAIAKDFAQLPITIIDGNSRAAMQAADCVLLASGTAALEAMLLGRPMVVGYRLSPITYHVLTKLNIMKIDRYSLPNLLAGEALVPEFIQANLSPADMAMQLLNYMNDASVTAPLLTAFDRYAEPLRANADVEAANAVQRLLDSQ